MHRAALESLDKEALIRLVLAQAEMIEKLSARVAELEAKLGLPPKTPDNSSQPPSQGYKPSAAAAARPKGKPHAGASRALCPDPTRRAEVKANVCPHCGADVSAAPQMLCEAYDHIEVPPLSPEVTRVSLFGGSCPCCAGRFKASPPAGMPPGSPFGPNLRALAIHLRFTQGIGFERLARLFKDLFGVVVSEGALVNILAEARQPFAAQAAAIRADLLGGDVVESDETSLRVGKANWWLWVFHHAGSAVFVAAPSRARSVPEAFLGEHRPRWWISDRYGGQMGLAAGENQICLAHLIRDARYAEEAGDAVVAPRLVHLLGRACRIGRRRERLADATLKAYAHRLEADLDRLMGLAPSHAAGQKLHRVVKKIRRHMFVFMTNRAIEPTNNGSERALRPAVTFRKITNGFRSEWGARLYADIRSVIETARRRACGALDAIRITLAGQPLPLTS
jgi:transposase